MVLDRRATAEIDSKATQELAAVAERAQLVQLMGDGSGRVYPVGSHGVLIGRADDAGVCLDSVHVSRQHARVTRSRSDGFVITDLGSRNGTRVNGVAVEGSQPLRFGDRIQIALETVLVFTHDDRLDEHLLQLEKLDAVAQLAGGLAHDFGNLLAAILGNVEYLARSCEEIAGVDPEIPECLGEIKRATDRGTELTRRLMNVARRGPAEAEQQDFSALAEEITSLIERTMPARIRVEWSIQPGLMVEGDRAGLHQILLNLCFNARDAMPEGGTLSVGVEMQRISDDAAAEHPFLAPGPYVVLWVEDSGVGMDADTQRRIFEPFFSTKSPDQGTGIGLATVDSVVRRHGGAIEVRSEPNRGSRFTVYLPAYDPARPFGRQETLAIDTALVRPAPAAESGAERSAILLIDASDLVRASVKRLIGRLGYVAYGAANGYQAVQLFEEHHQSIALVLLDLAVHNLVGEHTLTLLRRLDPAFKVLITSSGRDEELATLRDRVGAQGFLHKPYEPSQLADEIKRLVGKASR